MSLEQDKWQAAEARAVLDNPAFKGAFEAVSAYVEQRALSCDPDNKEMTQRVVLTKQILAAVKRELERVIDDGKVAEIRMAELEKKSILRAFRR